MSHVQSKGLSVKSSRERFWRLEKEVLLNRASLLLFRRRLLSPTEP